jgi:hypothetical protein
MIYKVKITTPDDTTQEGIASLLEQAANKVRDQELISFEDSHILKTDVGASHVRGARMSQGVNDYV